MGLAGLVSKPKSGDLSKALQPWQIYRWTSSHIENLKITFKWAAAPIIVVASIESTVFTNYYKEFVYIMAIIAHACCMPVFPRAKLIWFNFQLGIVWAVAYCICLFAGWCAVRARGGPNDKEPYNAASATIIAIWFIFGEWLSFAGRAFFPSWLLAFVLGGIVIGATLPGLVEVRTMEQVISVASLIIECFYTGQAIGLGVGLLIFPRSCRAAYMAAVEGSLQALSAVVKAHPGCLEQLVLDRDPGSVDEAAINKLAGSIQAFSGSVSKVQMQLDFAGQEWTFSHLNRSDLRIIANQLTEISAPLVGLQAITEKLTLVIKEDMHQDGEEAAEQHRQFVKEMKGHADELMSCIDGGITHALAHLGTRSRKSKIADAACLKGGCDHIAAFEKTVFRYRSLKGDLKDSAETYMMQQLFRDKEGAAKSLPYGALLGCFLSSHLLLLLSATGFEFYDLLLFLEESSHKSRRLHTPIEGLWTDFRKWLVSLTQRNTSEALYGLVFSRLAPAIKHDVDHLPPTNMIERMGDRIRRAWKFFGSANAGFGVRGALAMMTIGILAFLKDEHAFYNEQRFLWALFSIVLCMDRTAGSSTLKLIFRFAATFSSMVASYIIWYIVDQKTVGIIIFLFLWYCVLSYVELSSPKYGQAAFTAVIAATVMISNQLQVRKLGAEIVAASGQAVYGSYILFPLRLAQVTLGILVAYFWTLFPSPLPEHTELRHEAADAMINLATFGTSINQSVALQFGGVKAITSAGKHLESLRSRHRDHLTEHNALVAKMQSTMKAIPFEFSPGGKFPIKAYREMAHAISRLGNLFTLVGYVSHGLDGTQLAREMNEYDNNVQSHLCPEGVATRLVVLCSALRNGHPLPPSLRMLKVPDLRHFLDRRIATDECFATASLIHSANYMAMQHLNKLTELIGDIVGTLDFSLPLPELSEEV